jgi:hypothetical protein
MKDNRIADVIKRIENMENSGYRITCIGLKKENDYYVTELVHQLKNRKEIGKDESIFNEIIEKEFFE